MASQRALRWASWAAGFGSAAFALAFVWAVWQPAAAPPPETLPVSAPPPTLAPPPEPIEAPPSAEAALTDAANAYLAAVARAPGAGETSHELAVQRREVFQREVERLAALGEGAVPVLLARLESETNDHARLLFLTALSRIHGEAGERGTLAALEALQDPTLEPLFLDRLVRADDPASESLLEAVLRTSPHPETRVNVLASAARRRDSRIAARLPELALHDESPAVREQALATAEALGAPLEPALLEQMAHADPDPALRERALGVLASSDPGAFVRYARHTFETGTPDAEQARVLTQALARSEDPAAGALLTELAFDPDPAVRKQANRALRARSAESGGR